MLRRRATRPAAGDPFDGDRAHMVTKQLVRRGIGDPRVLAAMRAVPRHELVPGDARVHAYADRPLPIGHDATISQPYIVAAMTAAARISPDDRVLEIGTGSGYQAAVLAELGARVYSIEIVEPLAARAAADLARLGYHRVQLRTGDGHLGWPEAAPFQAIVVTAAPVRVPDALVAQLAVGGRLVIPVGEASQALEVITRDETSQIARTTLMEVRFVRMTGGSDQ